MRYNQPMNWNMLGHEWAVDLLKEHVASGNPRHAYLLTGPQGVGRRTIAMRLAQALNCPQPEGPGEPCTQCQTCKQIERMQHADLSVVQAEEIGGVLKVDQVRDLQRTVSLSAYTAPYRVALLLRFEEANQNAANALLKTLEEPPPKVVIVLTAESAERLLPTIVSRCEVLRLRPLALETVFEGLESRWSLPSEKARLLAHLSGGRIGYALRLHQEPDQLEQRNAWLREQAELLRASRVKRFAYAEEIAKDKERLRAALQVWLSFWRDVLLRAGEASAPLTNPDHAAEIAALAGQLGLGTAKRILDQIERTEELLDRNVNNRLVAEVLLLDLPHLPAAE